MNLKKIETLSNKYKRMVVETAPSYKLAKNDEEIKQNWWFALINFFDRTFYRGRRDSLSGKFEKNTIQVLVKYLGKNNEQRLKKLLELRDNESLDYKKYGFNPKNDVLPGHDTTLLSAMDDYITTNRNGREKKNKICTWMDKEMVVDTLSTISNLDYFDYNIVKYTISEIENKEVERLYKKLIDIRYVGPKTAPLFIRDTVSFHHLEDYFSDEDYVFVQPIDTWVWKISKEIGLSAKNPEDMKKVIVDWCLVNGVNPIKFNQGLWYLGTHSLELILNGFSL